MATNCTAAPVWLGQPMLAWDLETTGIDVEEDRVVTACAALLQPDTPTWRQEVQDWLICPQVDIPEAATAVHGITAAFAKEHGAEPSPALDEIATELTHAMLARIPVVGCNLAYDLTLLDRELRRHHLPTLPERLGGPVRPVLDALVLDKHVDPYRSGGRKLEQMCAHYGVRLEGAHSSTGDALAAARVVYRIGLLTSYPLDELQGMFAARKRPQDVIAALRALGAMTLDQVHEAQVGWRRAQCDSLRAHFDSRGTAHDGVPGDWPMIPWGAAEREVRPT